jgi:hypothetical protein
MAAVGGGGVLAVAGLGDVEFGVKYEFLTDNDSWIYR